MCFFYLRDTWSVRSPQNKAPSRRTFQHALANRHQPRVNGRFIKAASGIPQPIFRAPTTPTFSPEPGTPETFHTPSAATPSPPTMLSAAPAGVPPLQTPATPAAMQMPGRGHSSAPKFDGQPWSLKRFLREVHKLATEKGLSAEHAIRAALSYAPSIDYELWCTLASAQGSDWNAFETELYTIYPGSEGDRKYNRENLDVLARQTALLPMTDHLQFGQYYRSFLMITTFLKSKGRISDRECSAKFFEGLHYQFRSELADYLRIKDPAHHIDDSWDLATLYASALFVLSNRNGGTSTATAREHSSAPPVPVVKTEVFNTSSIGRYLDSDVFLNKIRALTGPPTHMQQNHAPFGQHHQGNYGRPPQGNNFAQPPHGFNYGQLPHGNNFGQPPPPQGEPPRTSEARFNMSNPPASYFTSSSGPPQPVQQQWQERAPGPNVCVFCSDPNHFQYACPGVADYISRGLCIRDGGQQLALPNGLRISTRVTPGNNIKERIDAWHQANPVPPARPVASTNLLGVSAKPEAPQQDHWAVFTHEITSNRSSETPVDKAAVPLTQRDLEEILVLQNVAASAARKIEETRAKIHASQLGPTTRARNYDTPATPPVHRDAPPHMSRVSEATVPTAPPAIAASAPLVLSAPFRSKNPFVSNAAGPQYTYHTPIESPQTIGEVVEQSLESTVTLTNRQLFAVAPEVRKMLKDQIGTRRSAAPAAPSATINQVSAHMLETDAPPGPTQTTVSVEAFLQSLLPRTDDVIVANHMEELRAINVQIGDAGTIEAIMDDGCQIMALRADVWARTNLPLRSDHLMTMESANQSTNDTKGLLADLPITIGTCTFYVQVQVVENASYEMLIGRPFHVLCQASMRHFSNGDAHLTLVDPNTQAVITIPTHARVKTPAKQALALSAVPRADFF